MHLSQRLDAMGVRPAAISDASWLPPPNTPRASPPARADRLRLRQRVLAERLPHSASHPQVMGEDSRHSSTMRAAAARSDAASYFKVSIQLDCAHQVIKILAIEPLVIEHRLHR